MKAKKHNTVTYTIELSEMEARMLKSYVQNPMSDDETKEWSDFRRLVFDAITDSEKEMAAVQGGES